jgi:general secretion pathway protein C
MQLDLDMRLRKLARRVPSVTIYRLGELGMMALVAMLAARLLWAIFTPVSPVGSWAQSRGIVAPTSAITDFDPFFRGNAPAGSAIVTSLQLNLFGIRLNEADGGGSAIIEIPGEGQQSYAAGEEIQPGVTLKTIAFDHIVISRGGIDEQLYMDQSDAVVPPAAVAASAVRPADAAALASAFSVGARTEGGRVTGVIVQPSGDGAAFREMGLQPGDILVSVNGQGVRSAEDVARQVADMPPGGATTLEVERGGRRVQLNPVVK